MYPSQNLHAGLFVFLAPCLDFGWVGVHSSFLVLTNAPQTKNNWFALRLCSATHLKIFVSTR